MPKFAKSENCTPLQRFLLNCSKGLPIINGYKIYWSLYLRYISKNFGMFWEDYVFKNRFFVTK